MKAYLIEPQLRRVTRIDLPDDGTLRDEMKRLIGANALDRIVVDNMHDSIWFDEMGFTREPCWAWRLDILYDPLPGTGIMIGADDRGRIRAPFIPLSFLQQHIVWLDQILPQAKWQEGGHAGH
jgi:hypothetical protein